MDQNMGFLNKTLVIGIILLFICMSITLSSAVDNVKKSSIPVSSGNTLYVGGSGPGNYSKIQYAIDNASDGDIVFVYDDSSPYNERIWINVSISLIGENHDSTIIELKENADIITINKDAVTIKGFTIQGKENCSWRGIMILTNNNIIISDNIFKNTYMGIYAISNNSCFTKNEFSSLGRGMWLLYSYNCQLIDNNFGYNSLEDITLGGSNCFVDNNSFTGVFGLKLWKCSYATVSNNTFLNTCIIDFYESSYNTVCHNTFEEGGFSLYEANNNLVFDNTRNGIPIFYLDGEKDKIIDYAAQVILIQCENIDVKGITFYNLLLGIYLENTKNSNISGNTFSNCQVGISLSLYSKNNVISNCFFNDCSNAITLEDSSNFNSIINNTVNNSDESAIIIDGSFNNISYNIVSNAKIGIGLTGAHPFQQPTYATRRRANVVSYNKVQYAQYGIIVDACFTNVKRNIVTDCGLGIGVEKIITFFFPSNDIKGNVIQENAVENNQFGLTLNISIFSLVQKNNFISNDQQVSFEGLGLFGQIIGTRLRRNYWGRAMLLPKIIHGVLYIPEKTGDKISYIEINWFEIDWLPARAPYSILI